MSSRDLLRDLWNRKSRLGRDCACHSERGPRPFFGTAYSAKESGGRGVVGQIAQGPCARSQPHARRYSCDLWNRLRGLVKRLTTVRPEPVEGSA
jgi:hypothetical protein